MIIYDYILVIAYICSKSITNDTPNDFRKYQEKAVRG